MRIRIHLKIFLFILLFCLTNQIEIYGLLMLFAFFHELGHLGMGLLLGLKPESITIMPLGLSIAFRSNPEDYNEKRKRGTRLAVRKMLIAIAGSLTNIVFIILFLVLPLKLPEQTRLHCIYANILIGLFNLLPIYPLDGGRILKNIFHLTSGLKIANRLMYQISNSTVILLTAISSIAILYFQNIAILFIIVYLWGLVISENKKYQIKNKVYDLLEKSV